MYRGDKMFKYETHLHTSPASRCAHASVEESLKFYKSLGYDGVFITNHFYQGDDKKGKSYEEMLNSHFADYENGLEFGKTIGIKVFFGTEITYNGTDFLVYGLDKEWFFDHPEIEEMKMRDKLTLMEESGALIIQAHPFREASYIDHIRLFPRNIHGVEIINASRSDEENNMAKHYAEQYSLLKFAGSDNHTASKRTKLAGVCCAEPVCDVEDFIEKVKNHKIDIFTLTNEI